jgi:hypothetical protein
VAKEVNGAAIVEARPVACTGMAVSPSLLLAAAFAAVLAGRGVFQWAPPAFENPSRASLPDVSFLLSVSDNWPLDSWPGEAGSVWTFNW